MSSQLEEKFVSYSHRQLLAVITKPGDYIPAAIQIAELEIERRGGRVALAKIVEQESIEQRRNAEITAKAKKGLREGMHYEQVMAGLVEQFPAERERIIEIVREENRVLRDERERATATTGSTIRAVYGALLGAVVGGLVMGFMIGRHNIIVYLVVGGVIYFCYLMIKLFSGGKTHNGIAILMLLSVVCAALIASFTAGFFVPAQP